MSAPAENRVVRVPHGKGEVALAYLEWGAPDAERTAVCVHGISRNAHDFRWLAHELATAGWRVLAFDMVGRGSSDWLDDPAGYVMPSYAAHMSAAIKALGLDHVDWIGTSMGGILGMVMAASGAPLRRLVLNDIGPHVSAEALAGIVEAVGQQPVFGSVGDAEAFLKARFAPYGPVADSQWATIAAHSVRRDERGALRLHFDPAIVVPFGDTPPPALDLWKLWDVIKVPTLVLRGGVSEILDQKTAEAMTTRGPRATLFTFHGIAHPLWLTDNEQIHLVRDWLLGHPRSEDPA